MKTSKNKDKVQKPKEPQLFKVERGIKLPKKKTRVSEIAPAVLASLRELGEDESFLIEKKHEPTVRRMLNEHAQEFKDYLITIRAVEDEGEEFKRVFRLKPKR